MLSDKEMVNSENARSISVLEYKEEWAADILRAPGGVSQVMCG